MEVDHADERVIGVLLRDPVPHCADVVAEMYFAGWLEAAEHALAPTKGKGAVQS
jgi:hypothetical protein